MKRQLLYVFLLFVLKHKITYATIWPQRYTEMNVYLQGFTLEASKVDTVFACYAKCEDNILCTSINMNLANKTCELKYSTKAKHPEKVVDRPNTIYMDIRDDDAAPGSRQEKPISSCKWWKEIDNQAKSGVYWMRFKDSLSEAFQVFCEMTIDGGGWTLVYSYTFTNYDNFGTISNAITPLPNWPVDRSSGLWSPQSTVTPLSESSHSAMDFALWKKIGNEILLKSNITNWFSCLEGTGSLVNWNDGSLTCRVVKAITPTCTTIVPNIFKNTYCGPGFFRDIESKHYIFLEGRTDTCWPVHDPCGTMSAGNVLTSVLNPGGALYVR